MPPEQLLQVTVEDVSESVGGMQRRFFDNPFAVGKRDAPELGGRVDGKDHLVS
jgi:hypothetical protein